MGGQIHNEASKLKRTVVNAAGKTMDKIEGARNLTEHSTAKMDQDLKNFKYALQQLGGTTSEHDHEAVDKMVYALTTLRNRHEKMQDWHGNFKSRTAAWREAVENQMRKMGRDV